MLPYLDFMEDSSSLLIHIISAFETNQELLPFPCRIVGVKAYNFETIEIVKPPSTKLNNFFKSQSKHQRKQDVQKITIPMPVPEKKRPLSKPRKVSL